MQNHVTQTGSDQASFVRQLFSDRHIGAMLVLGFSSGIPFLLVYVTQSAWLSEAKVPISILGLMSELTQALMSSWSEVGWRIGNLVAGAGALYLADAIGWRAAYLCMAMMMAPGMIAALLAPESESDKKPRSEHPSFVATVTGPIKELVVRLGPMGIPILLLVAGFRMPGYISSAMAVPLFKSLHYSNSDIATVLASYVVKRIGLMSSLLAGTVFASASHLSLAYLAVHGDHGRACP
jgi:hypothetical protein